MKLLALLSMMFLASCALVRPPNIIRTNKNANEGGGDLVVLIDENPEFYHEVITGIHVASHGSYQVWQMHEEGLVQSALVEQVLNKKPGALIALGPRSANAIATNRIILPSAFAMVPRLENYDFGSVFSSGIRMVPEVKIRLELIKSLLPELKSLGVVYNRNNSRMFLQRLYGHAEHLDIELIVIEAGSSSEVLEAVKHRSHELSAILMIDDPIMLDVDLLSALTAFLRDRKIALFGIDCSMVQAGAFAALSTNYFEVGKELVSLVSNNKKSRPPKGTAYYDPKLSTLCFNIGTSEAIGVNNAKSRALKYSAEKGVTIRAFY